MSVETSPDAAGQPQAVVETVAAEHGPLGIWLRHRLHQSYDATVAEPIPADLLRLLEDDETSK